MPKHWIYIIQNDEDGEIYVGETVRLYSRLNEHLNNRGANNTKLFRYITLVGLYKISNNANFLDYRHRVKYWDDFELNKFIFENWRDNEDDSDFLKIENCITEHCIINFKDNIVRGGKYTKESFDYDKITNSIDKDLINSRPVCKCGFPAEVFLSKNNYVFFKCAVSNANFIEYENPNFSVAEPCDFIKKYTEDTKLQLKYRDYEEKENDDCIKLLPKLYSKNDVSSHPCILCNKTGYACVFNFGFRQLCKNCLVHKFDQVKNYKPSKIRTKPIYNFIYDD